MIAKERDSDEMAAAQVERVELVMYLSEAVDEIREKLVKHRLAPRKFLWRTMLMQIKKAGYFDGHLENPILEAIRSFVRPLDDATIKSLWRETETGMCNENDADRWFTDDLRYDVEMEILQHLMDMACYEATGKWPNRAARNHEAPDDV
jgi:hypothetical protein